MEDREKAIIFMALSNQILIYQSKLENHEYEDEIEKEIYKSIIEESMSLLDRFMPKEPSSHQIPRPTF
jgi:hypothetical protein